MSVADHAQWYYAKNGAQTGPLELPALTALITNGQVTSQDMVWCEGMATWLPVAQVPALQTAVFHPAQPAAASSPPPAAQFSAAPTYLNQQAYAQPAYNTPQRFDPNRGPSQQGMAIAGFVLALVFPLLGLIFSLIALSGMKKYRNDEGKGFAKAGLIISIIFMSIACLWTIFVFGLIGAAAAGGR